MTTTADDNNNSNGMKDREARPSKAMRIQISIPKTQSQQSLPTITGTSSMDSTTTPRNNSKLHKKSTSLNALSTATTATATLPVMTSIDIASIATPAVSSYSSATSSVTKASGSNKNKEEAPKVSPTPPSRKSFASTATSSAAPAPAKPFTWPKDSSTALPPLSTNLCQGLTKKTLKFSINDECTALKLAPTGRLLVGGFSDGTVRLFDLTGTYSNKKNKGNKISSHTKENTPLQQQQTNQTTETTQTHIPTGSFSSSSSSYPSQKQLVCSKNFQQYGAVACQIHAKGVHTNLLMDVDVSEDGLWAFAGVLRGSMELVAVHLGHLEASFPSNTSTSNNTNTNTSNNSNSSATDDTDSDSCATGGSATTALSARTNLLDHVTVFRHSDAKLRGFGACTRLKTQQQHCTGNANGKPKYLLFTGKAIKNIHIWSFEPPDRPDAPPVWQCLYDTQTNGNTIKMLQFRYNGVGSLLGVSKSDGQKLRVWDLSHEQQNESNGDADNDNKKDSYGGTKETKRPNRPPFQDVTHTESTLGVAGGFCLNGGSELYNQMSIVSLDVENLQSLYNHTELALPSSSSSASNSNDGSGTGMVSSRRRQQRGELKSIVSVAGPVLDAGQVLLELNDGSILQYTTQVTATDSGAVSGLPKLSVWKEAGLLGDSVNRKICVGRVGSGGVALAALAVYDPSRGRGRIVLRALDPLPSLETETTMTTTPSSSNNKSHRSGFWGFLGPPTLPNPVPMTILAAQSVPDIQALTETIHPISTAEKTNKEKKNDNSNIPESQALMETIHPITTAKKPKKEKSNSSSIPESQALLETIHPITTAKKSKKEKNNSSNIPESQALMETIHPIMTAKKLKKEKSNSSNIPESQALLETIHPITTAKKPKKEKHINNKSLLLQELLETAKKGKLHAQTTRMPLVTPKAVGQDSSSTSTQQLTLPLARRLATTTPKEIPLAQDSSSMSTQQSTLPLARRLATTTPKGLPRVSLDENFMDTTDDRPSPVTAAATMSEATNAVDDATEKRSAAKYLKTANGAKKSTLVVKPTEATKRRPSLASKKQASKKEDAAAFKLVLAQHPKGRSPPVPRKHMEGSDTKEAPEIDVAAALCNLSASPMRVIPTPRNVIIPTPRNVANNTVQRVTKTSNAAAKSPLRSHIRKDGEAAKKRIVRECLLQQTKIVSLLDELPKSTVASRVNLSSVVTHTIEEVHVLARGKLAAQHQAAHEMMQKKVLRAALGIIQSLRRSPSVGAVEESKGCFEGMIQSFKEIVDDLIFQQQMEASTLAGQQTFERQGEPAPALIVSFAFPSVFQQALDCTPKLN